LLPALFFGSILAGGSTFEWVTAGGSDGFAPLRGVFVVVNGFAVTVLPAGLNEPDVVAFGLVEVRFAALGLAATNAGRCWVLATAAAA
jgi:hypothetical protein